MEPWEEWSLEELEKQMSPSCWNPNKTRSQVIEDYITTGTNETKKAIETVPTELNVSYGPKKSQKLDIYGTDLGKKAQSYLFIHGGYWQEGSKDISGGSAMYNYSKGIRTIVLGYTLAPEGSIAEMRDELVMALNLIVGIYDESDLVIGGHSAGAQLAALLLFNHQNFELSQKIIERISGLCFISGVYDLRPLVRAEINNPLHLTTIGAKELSPLCKEKTEINTKFTTSKLMELKIVVLYAQMDPDEFKRQSQKFYEFLKNSFSQVELIEYGAADHFTVLQNHHYYVTRFF